MKLEKETIANLNSTIRGHETTESIPGKAVMQETGKCETGSAQCEKWRFLARWEMNK